jgi:hypothetical protein
MPDPLLNSLKLFEDWRARGGFVPVLARFLLLCK